jgi:hypothetical protein
LANGSSQATLDAAMRSFNDGQMAPTPVVQQQQQAQPERTTKKK